LKQKNFLLLKYILPFALGIYLIWFIFNSLTPDETQTVLKSIQEANYFWIFIFLCLGFLSHASRSLRWMDLLETVGKRPKFLNSFFCVFIAYFMNMILPRAGEAARCAYLAKYENISFDKSLGTVVAERIVDVVFLLLITIVTVYLQIDLMSSYYNDWKEIVLNKLAAINTYYLIVGIIISALIIIFIYKRAKSNGFFAKLVSFLKGFSDGLKSVFTTKKKWSFLFHSIFIWVMYLGMIWVSFFAFKETTTLPIEASLTTFVLATIAIILTPGGIGAYPIAVMQALLLFGISKESGLAAGWVIWMAQTVMIIIFGGLSLLFIPIYNKKKVSQFD
jgi:glycosyltransferase 2 family protein